MPPYMLASVRAVTVISFFACAASAKLVSLNSIPDSVLRRLIVTAPLEDWTHGRAATVTSTRLELLLVMVSGGSIAPAAAVFSTRTGPTLRPPSAAAARGFAPSARAITAPLATAARITTPANARRPTIDICKDPLFTPTSPSRRKPGRDANVAPGSESLWRGGAERERQRLAVRPGPQRVVGPDVLLETDHERVVGHRRAPGPRHAQDLQRLRQRERPVGHVAGIAHAERGIARGGDHVRGRRRLVGVRDARGERAERRRRTERERQRRGHRAADRAVVDVGRDQVDVVHARRRAVGRGHGDLRGPRQRGREGDRDGLAVGRRAGDLRRRD